MNKNIYLIPVLVGLVVLIGAACTTVQNTNSPVDTESTGIVSDATPVSETNQYTYKNTTYGFSLVFPENWGVVTEKVNTAAEDTTADGSKIYASIILDSANDGRFIKIQVVKVEDKNDPAVIDYLQKYITENATYSYYYTGAGCCVGYPGTEEYDLDIQTEVEAIIKTFTLEESTEPLSYSTDGVSATVYKEQAQFDLTATQLRGNADECGTQYATGYFEQLVAKFKSPTMLKYDFQYTGESQAADTFKVTLISNLAGYTSLDQFKNDWDICATGGSLYPKKLNNDWLLFTNSCGPGFDDGSGLPIGCDEVKKVVEPSLELNSGTTDTTASVDAITYEKFTTGDRRMTFDIPFGMTVTDNVNGFPDLWKFIYNENSYLISYSEDQGDSSLKWASRDESEVTVTNHDNITVYSENGFAHTAAYFLQPNPLAHIGVSKQVGTGLKSDGDYSSDLDEVYQQLVSSVKLDGVVAF